MGFLDFVKSEEKRASSPEEDVSPARGAIPGEVEEEAGDDLHRGMKPRQLSMLLLDTPEWLIVSSTHLLTKIEQIWQVLANLTN